MSAWGDPLGATDLWYRVTQRENDTCHCTGQCGRKHKPAKDEPVGCRRGLPWDRLLVAPADASIPVSEAFLVPEAELTTWCEPCLDSARALARKVARHDHQADPLFDIPEAS